MRRSINTQRACWANAALSAFQRTVNEDDCETAMVDLIADLGHLAKKRRSDYLAILRRGIRAWAYEERDPDGMGPLPSVSIRISPVPDRRCPRKTVSKGGAA